MPDVTTTPMGNRPINSTPFAEWLAREMRIRDWGARTLARRMNQDNPEAARRAVNRYLYDGKTPTPSYRTTIAEALGVPESDIPESDDTEPG